MYVLDVSEIRHLYMFVNLYKIEKIYLEFMKFEKINIEFATKSVVINDNDWSGHRLSTKRHSGFINSLGVSWIKDNIRFVGDIYNQGFDLDKANIKSGYGIGFSSSILF